jgi:hypothetical protein
MPHEGKHQFLWGLGVDLGKIGDAACTRSGGSELAAYLHLHPHDVDSLFSRFAIEIVAVAGCQARKSNSPPFTMEPKPSAFGAMSRECSLPCVAIATEGFPRLFSTLAEMIIGTSSK